MPGSKNDGGPVITPVTSKRICSHMNEDHRVSVYAMVLQKLTVPSGWKITDCQMASLSANGCKLRATMCRGDLCQMEQIEYPFVPPLESSSEARSRMVSIHNQVCRPKWTWLLSPLATFLLFMIAFLSYCMYVGLDTVENMIEEDETASSFIAFVFGTPTVFTKLVRGCFWFTVVAHFLEASYAAHQCRVALKLKWSVTLEWAFLASLVGGPVLGYLLELVAVNAKRKKTKKT